jgi:lipoprotein Spr
MALFSCSSTLKTASSNKSAANTAAKGPRFLDGISVNPGDRVSSRNKSYGYSEKAPEEDKTETDNSHLSLNESTLVSKYATILGVEDKKVSNIDLIEEIDDWYGTPYHFGGSSKNGIDCSAFSRTLSNDVFNVSLPRTAEEQYDYCDHIKKSQLKQGDLVFFHTSGRSRITHVGVYLQNGKFVHASTSSGVMISDLDEYYWKRAYRAAGRIPKDNVTKN